MYYLHTVSLEEACDCGGCMMQKQAVTVLSAHATVQRNAAADLQSYIAKWTPCGTWACDPTRPLLEVHSMYSTA